MRVSTLMLAAVATLCLSVPSLAATVQSVQGQVSVNAGTGYQLVRSGAAASPGAIVMANPGGSAQIVYPDGCVVRVDPGAVVTVQDRSPCAVGQVDYTPYIVGGVAVAGAVTGIILFAQKNENKPASP